MHLNHDSSWKETVLLGLSWYIPPIFKSRVRLALPRISPFQLELAEGNEPDFSARNETAEGADSDANVLRLQGYASGCHRRKQTAPVVLVTTGSQTSIWKQVRSRCVPVSPELAAYCYIQIRSIQWQRTALQDHYTPIGLADVPILVFRLDAFPPPCFSIADFKLLIVDTISPASAITTNQSIDNSQNSGKRERDALASLGFSASNS